MSEPILEVENLKKTFRKRNREKEERGKERFRGGGETFAAVDGVSFSVAKGESLGLIGESGSGKSTTARMAAGLLRPDAGEIRFYGRHRQMVFQDPMRALDPRMTVLQSIEEGLLYERGGRSREQIRRQALEAMELVRLPQSYAGRRSRELSGGECQRATIARAILIRPELLICDEVTSALDVSVQAQIMELLNRLRRELGLSILFISHDIALVGGFCSRAAVMYQGKIVEMGETRELLRHPREAYTRRLLEAVPDFSKEGEK